MIASLEDDSDITHYDHAAKALCIYNSFKNRLGTFEFKTILFYLHSLLHKYENLDCLELPFTREEIDNIILTLLIDKSSCLHGFNNEFMKKCWPTMKNDFYDLCQEFFDGNICLQSINESHIILIPKKDHPTNVVNFRPVFLLNGSIKLITKVLANKLEKVILPLIHANQYGFLKSRSI